MKSPEFPKIPESSRTIKTLIGGVFGVLFVFLLQQILFKNPAPVIDKQLQSLVTEYNKSCPIYVDSETRIDNATALPNKTIQYNYTLVHLTYDSIDINEIRQRVEPGLNEFVKSNPSLKGHRANRETFNFSFQDKNKHFLFLIKVTPESYKDN